MNLKKKMAEELFCSLPGTGRGRDSIAPCPEWLLGEVAWLAGQSLHLVDSQSQLVLIWEQ